MNATNGNGDADAPTQAALGAFGLLALSAWIVAPARTGPQDTDHHAALGADLAWPSSRGGPEAKGAAIEAPKRLASSAVEGAAGHGQYVGDFHQMMAAYDGFGPAKAVLDELCATQAPGFQILAVYRPGDVERDAWCIAQYGEVDEFLDAPTALIGEQPAPRR